MKIAIVGAEESKWTEEQKRQARIRIRVILVHELRRTAQKQFKAEHTDEHAFVEREQTILVSGHCPKGGVDIWAEEIADELGIEKEIYPAEVHQWNNLIVGGHPGLLKPVKPVLKGYRSRNMDIAKACDILYDIEPKGSCRYCSGRGYKNFIHIRPEGRKSIIRVMCRRCGGTGNYSGATWTMKYTKKLGKEVHQVVIE